MTDIVDRLRSDPHRVSTGLVLEAADEIKRLRRLQHAFRNADAMDWSRLFGMLEDADDGAYSRFWLAVLTETKEALAYDAANTPANTDYAKTDKTDATS